MLAPLFPKSNAKNHTSCHKHTKKRKETDCQSLKNETDINILSLPGGVNPRGTHTHTKEVCEALSVWQSGR